MPASTKNVRLSESIHKQLRIHSAYADQAITQIVETAIAEWCERNKSLIPSSDKPRREKKSAAV